MLVWFHQWKQEHRLWPLLPACDVQFGALATATIQTSHFWHRRDQHDTGGEMQALRVLTTLQYLVEVGPKSLPAGQITQSVQSIMWPLQQADTSIHTPCCVRVCCIDSIQHVSVETDVSFADISSLPLSVGFAGDMP